MSEYISEQSSELFIFVKKYNKNSKYKMRQDYCVKI